MSESVCTDRNCNAHGDLVQDIEFLIAETERLRRMLYALGFCAECGESMPCLHCGPDVFVKRYREEE